MSHRDSDRNIRICTWTRDKLPGSMRTWQVSCQRAARSCNPFVCFHERGSSLPGLLRDSLLYPGHITEKCWGSYWTQPESLTCRCYGARNHLILDPAFLGLLGISSKASPCSVAVLCVVTNSAQIVRFGALLCQSIKRENLLRESSVITNTR